tara:strand:+ start:362 stop:1060 length:699 start_codon:yes stop_codon:yes gene_type:complete
MKICYINQQLGIGDVFFGQKIAHHYVQDGYRVIWPVRADLLWYNDYIEAPGVHFVEPNTKILVNDEEVEPDVYLDLQNADQKVDTISVLEAKYDYAGIDWRDWADYFKFKRNSTKEDALYYDVLGLKDDEEYAFINPYVGTPPNTVIKEAMESIKIDIKRVDIQFLDSYNVLDWCKVLENATEIHMVDTCFNYIFDKLEPKARVKDLYSRFTPGSWHDVGRLFKFDWNYLNI